MISIKTVRVGVHINIDVVNVSYVPDFAGDYRVLCFQFTQREFNTSKIHLKTAVINKRVMESYDK